MSDALIITGDCLDTLRRMPDASVDAVVTDPPYGLSKEPDALDVLRHWLAGDDYEHRGSGFMGKTWDSFVPGPTIWREVLRVLKPGGHACVFAGSRTVDLMGLSLRIAGFEIRDQLQWIYGSGFPKSLNVSKAIDATILTGGSSPKNQADAREATGQAEEGKGTHAFKTDADSKQGTYRNKPGSGATWQAQTDDAKRWEGYGTALKPAHEPIVLARKPLIGTVAANVLEHGTGGMNIDGCRIGTSKSVPWSGRKATDQIFGKYGAQDGSESGHDPNVGRWPANVILDEAAGAMLDEQTGARRSAGHYPSESRGTNTSVTYGNDRPQGALYADSGGASRFMYCAKTSRTEREAGLEHMRKASAGELTGGRAEGSAGIKSPRAGAGNTSSGRANVHPTVKPIALMRWLVRLVTPPGGLVLDPFAGSGSTGCAAVLEGVEFLGCELSEEYATIARVRIAHWASKPGEIIDRQLEMNTCRPFADEV
jgi:DNA modification methylase